MIRVGQGFDVHRHSDDPERVLILGGCTFEGERGLDGHSDADVPAHAAADALLGAAGLGDLGTHFPDTDSQWAGADSLMILAATADMVRQAGWTIGNVDVKVVCERPKLAPHRDFLEAARTGKPDLTLQALCDRLLAERGVKADTSMMSRFFRRIGVTVKKRRLSRASRTAGT